MKTVLPTLLFSCLALGMSVFLPSSLKRHAARQETLCTCRSFEGRTEMIPEGSVELVLKLEFEKEVMRLFPKCTEHEDGGRPSEPIYIIRSSAPYLLICSRSYQEFRLAYRELVQYCLPE